SLALAAVLDFDLLQLALAVGNAAGDGDDQRSLLMTRGEAVLGTKHGRDHGVLAVAVSDDNVRLRDPVKEGRAAGQYGSRPVTRNHLELELPLLLGFGFAKRNSFDGLFPSLTEYNCVDGCVGLHLFHHFDEL